MGNCQPLCYACGENNCYVGTRLHTFDNCNHQQEVHKGTTIAVCWSCYNEALKLKKCSICNEKIEQFAKKCMTCYLKDQFKQIAKMEKENLKMFKENVKKNMPKIIKDMKNNKKFTENMEKLAKE